MRTYRVGSHKGRRLGKGRETAARYADTVVAHPKGLQAMKDYRQDVRVRMRAAGRNPDSCKVLFMATPVLASRP